MKLFQQKTTIETYKTAADFVKEYEIGQEILF